MVILSFNVRYWKNETLRHCRRISCRIGLLIVYVWTGRGRRLQITLTTHSKASRLIVPHYSKMSYHNKALKSFNVYNSFKRANNAPLGQRKYLLQMFTLGWNAQTNLLISIPKNSSDLTAATYFSIKLLSDKISFIIEPIHQSVKSHHRDFCQEHEQF